MAQKRVSSLSGEYLEAIGGRLMELQVDADAAAVVLVDLMGQIIAQAGNVRELDISTIVSLLAASFATTSEMSRQLQETRRTFNLTFDRDIYAPKIGMVWLYIKRSIQDVLRIVAQTEATRPKETLATDFAKSLSEELDVVFEEKKPPSRRSLTQDEDQITDLIRWPRKRH